MLESSDRGVVLKVINAIDVPVTVVDVVARDEFAVFAINEAAERCTGLSNADIAGHLVHYVVPDDIATRLVEEYQACVDRREPVEYDDEHFDPAVARRARTTLVPIAGDNGRVVRIVATSYPLVGASSDDETDSHTKRKVA